MMKGLLRAPNRLARHFAELIQEVPSRRWAAKPRSIEDGTLLVCRG